MLGLTSDLRSTPVKKKTDSRLGQLTMVVGKGGVVLPEGVLANSSGYRQHVAGEIQPVAVPRWPPRSLMEFGGWMAASIRRWTVECGCFPMKFYA
ncbi:hypothetical protein Nepgr_003694 [Nepenthes gracilis]|uniref:Uncharacterized protein n=1 Tax=Nepenthes gracilis TaxID=150966 RepID=A0AAD3S002_NEPGR|nr:hypothetical protein Nepgr_003694 [Nepenthes gracilis]